MRYSASITVSIAVVFSSLAAADDLSISTDFPSGSGEVVVLNQPFRAVHIKPTPHPDRGWACWWYVKVAGIKPGETIELTVGDAPWATPDRAAFSIDNKTWTQTAKGQRKDRTITYRQKVDAAECWFAWGPPLSPDDAEQLVDSTAESSPHASAFQLCRTRAGRKVPALHIREENKELSDKDRRGIWIQARQHAWESGSSWVCRGLIEWLVSDDDRARLLRRTSDIYIVPVMDIDNVAIGAGGKSQRPQDHNRDWSDEPHWNAVREAQRMIKAMDDEKRFALFIDLHNPGASARHPFFYVSPRDKLTDSASANLERFLAANRLDMTGPLSYEGETQESGPSYDKNWRKISKNWVTFHTRDGVVAVTLETAWNTPNSTTDGYRTVGRQLGLATERYFRTEAAE